MISERSCGTKEWNNDAENAALQFQNFFFLNIKTFQLQYFYNIIINAASASIKDFQKHWKSLHDPPGILWSLI